MVNGLGLLREPVQFPFPDQHPAELAVRSSHLISELGKVVSCGYLYSLMGYSYQFGCNCCQTVGIELSGTFGYFLVISWASPCLN